MKTRNEARLECLRMASALGHAKVIPPNDIVGFAMEFFRWVDDDPNDKADLTPLAEKFARRTA